MPRATRLAHIFGKKWRSDDVRIQEEHTFSSLHLPENILAGLKNAGYEIPSPIQLKAIPIGRYGRDLLVQAKSGTGKTLVYTIIALEKLSPKKYPQVLIVTPIREVAIQICDVVRSVGSAFKGLTCNAFIGGESVEQDIEKVRGSQIVVGTPGRLADLISRGSLPTDSICLFVMDEADRLIASCFLDNLSFMFTSIPNEKQIIASCVTYPKSLEIFIQRCLQKDVFLLCLKNDELNLLGQMHYIKVLELSKMSLLAHKTKLAALEAVLTTVKFAQCLVFSNLITRVEGLCYDIQKWGFTTTYISSDMLQSNRIKAIECLKHFKCKVLVSSDVAARGIDAENVNLVINFDMPINSAIYLHRCGRAGRYGAKAVAITFVAVQEVPAFEQMTLKHNTKAYYLPDPIPGNLISIRPEESDCLDELLATPSKGDEVLNHPSDSGVIVKENNLADPSKPCYDKISAISSGDVVMKEVNPFTKGTIPSVNNTGESNITSDKPTHSVSNEAIKSHSGSDGVNDGSTTEVSKWHNDEIWTKLVEYDMEDENDFNVANGLEKEEDSIDYLVQGFASHHLSPSDGLAVKTSSALKELNEIEIENEQFVRDNLNMNNGRQVEIRHYSSSSEAYELYKSMIGKSLNKNKMNQDVRNKKNKVARGFPKRSKSSTNVRYTCVAATPHLKQTKSTDISNTNNRICAKNRGRGGRLASNHCNNGRLNMPSNYYNDQQNTEGLTPYHCINNQQNQSVIPNQSKEWQASSYSCCHQYFGCAAPNEWQTRQYSCCHQKFGVPMRYKRLPSYSCCQQNYGYAALCQWQVSGCSYIHQKSNCGYAASYRCQASRYSCIHQNCGYAVSCCSTCQNNVPFTSHTNHY